MSCGYIEAESLLNHKAVQEHKEGNSLSFPSLCFNWVLTNQIQQPSLAFRVKTKSTLHNAS